MVFCHSNFHVFTFYSGFECKLNFAKFSISFFSDFFLSSRFEIEIGWRCAECLAIVHMLCCFTIEPFTFYSFVRYSLMSPSSVFVSLLSRFCDSELNQYSDMIFSARIFSAAHSLCSAGCGSFQKFIAPNQNISMIQLFYCVNSTILWVSFFLRPVRKYRRIIEKLFAHWTQMWNDKNFQTFLLMEFWSLLWFLIHWSKKNIVENRKWNNRMHTHNPFFDETKWNAAETTGIQLCWANRKTG